MSKELDRIFKSLRKVSAIKVVEIEEPMSMATVEAAMKKCLSK